jgi:hypothetical protein
MYKKFQKSWLHGLWDYNVWIGKNSFFPGLPIWTSYSKKYRPEVHFVWTSASMSDIHAHLQSHRRRGFTCKRKKPVHTDVKTSPVCTDVELRPCEHTHSRRHRAPYMRMSPLCAESRTEPCIRVGTTHPYGCKAPSFDTNTNCVWAVVGAFK